MIRNIWRSRILHNIYRKSVATATASTIASIATAHCFISFSLAQSHWLIAHYLDCCLLVSHTVGEYYNKE